MSESKMTSGEFVEVLGGPLDGSKMEVTEETRMGFTHKSNQQVYVYQLRQDRPTKGSFIIRRRYVLKEVVGGKRKSER
jgi:hypothetical protein